MTWRQLAAIPESTLKAAILKALDIAPPPEGVSNTFHDGGVYVQRCDNYWLVSLPAQDQSLGSCFMRTKKEVLSAIGAPKGTPLGDALRLFLQ